MNDQEPGATESSKLYERVQQYVLDLIHGAAYSAGDKIPSERELAELTGISRMTVRKAVSQLIARGVLERRGTSGTFVPEPIIRRPISSNMFSHSLSDIVRQCGGEPGSRVLAFEQSTADERVSSRIKVRPGAPLIVMRRLRFVDDLPFCIETTHIPAERVPDLIADDLFGQKSLHALLRERYGIRVRGGQGTISAHTASPSEAKLLGLGRDSSVLLLQATSYDVEGRPIEYLNSLNHPQRVVFETT